MDPSKHAGKGILASLEHRTAEPPRRPAIATPSRGRGGALVVGIGVLTGALLAWWLYGGLPPLIVHQTLPPSVHAAPSRQVPAPTVDSAAAIVDEAPPPVLAMPAAAPAALTAALPPAPVAAPARRRDRVAAPRPKPKATMKEARPLPARAVHARRVPPDTDVALLSALVAHANERDVIEPRPGDSTASLLQRCQRVGGEEGRLCRVRICAARGGHDGCDGD